jgi:hypothetical protein
MHEEGLIYVREYRRDNPAGQLSAVWAWQPEPHFYPDVARPVPVRAEEFAT